jgi:hypothetical protein
LTVLRKCIAIFFLLLVLFPLTGFVFFHYQQKQIRISVKKTFKTKELSTVHVRQLRWYKKNKEIIVNGTLFDVSSIRKEADGTYTVKGLYDYQEQQLHALMDKATQRSQKTSGLLMAAFCFISHGHHLDSIIPFNLSFECEQPFSRPHSFFTQYIPGILKPPPQPIGSHHFS